MVKVVLFGPPGSGKGTQGKKISVRFDVPHIATGDILRDAMEKGTELGKKAKEYVIRGELVPDEVVMGIVKEKLDEKKGFVLDGFPRNIKQAEFLDSIISRYLVVSLLVSDDEILRRIAGRRICSNCGKIYNIYYSPPRVKGICNDCGGTLITREDDSEDKVRRRIEVYHSTTKPVIEYYKSRGNIVEIPGEGEEDEIFSKIEDEIKKFFQFS